MKENVLKHVFNASLTFFTAEFQVSALGSNLEIIPSQMLILPMTWPF